MANFDVGNQRSKANFSFRCMSTCVTHSVEKLGSDPLLGPKPVHLSILSTQLTHFLNDKLGELRLSDAQVNTTGKKLVKYFGNIVEKGWKIQFP